MSLKEIMKLRMTISRQTVIHSVIVEKDSDNTVETHTNVVSITEYASLDEDFSVAEWRDKLKLNLKEAELSFHYKDS